MKTAISFSNLSCQIAGNDILKELDLKVPSQSYFALAGINGAGKSTLIKLAMDLIRPVSGEILIFDQMNQDSQCRQILTYLPEKFDVKKEVTGWQYIQFVFGIYSQKIDKTRVLNLCEQLCLDTDRLEHKASTYSKGMKQKLGLISCFMLDKPLIILDEPLSGLDPKARFHFKALLVNERNKNRTIFYSTHMLADAEDICDQFGILHDGEMKFVGTPGECMEKYQAKTLELAYMNCISTQPQ